MKSPAILLIALLTLAACDRKKEPPPPKPRAAPVQPRLLANFEKGIAKMQRMEHSPAAIKSARRKLPTLIAVAETRSLRAPGSASACAAWDRVAENTLRQNDPALVHVWGKIADQRCAGSGRETRYWDTQAQK